MKRNAKIYLLAVDAEERRIVMQLPDSALSGVEKVKRVFGKGARVVAYTAKQPDTARAPQPKRA